MPRSSSLLAGWYPSRAEVWHIAESSLDKSTLANPDSCESHTGGLLAGSCKSDGGLVLIFHWSLVERHPLSLIARLRGWAGLQQAGGPVCVM